MTGLKICKIIQLPVHMKTQSHERCVMAPKASHSSVGMSLPLPTSVIHDSWANINDQFLLLSAILRSSDPFVSLLKG